MTLAQRIVHLGFYFYIAAAMFDIPYEFMGDAGKGGENLVRWALVTLAIGGIASVFTFIKQRIELDD